MIIVMGSGDDVKARRRSAAEDMQNPALDFFHYLAYNRTAESKPCGWEAFGGEHVEASGSHLQARVEVQGLILSVITVGLSYGLYKGVIDNYLAEVAGMSGFDKGVSEFFRELPGLLLVFILAATIKTGPRRRV